MVLLLHILFISTMIWPIQSDTTQIEALDSDYLSLYIQRSSIPAIPGEGVFARYDIDPNVIICEYRGAVVPAGTLIKSDKMMSVTGPDGSPMSIVGGETPSICPLVNDCAVIFNTSYSEEEIETFSNDTSTIPTYPGTTYNCRPMHLFAKIFYLTTRKILKGEEIFVPYGSSYWVPRLKYLHSNPGADLSQVYFV